MVGINNICQKNLSARFVVVTRINPYCHRTVYFVINEDFNHKSHSIEELYTRSVFFSFNKKAAGRFAISLNISR